MEHNLTQSFFTNLLDIEIYVREAQIESQDRIHV